MGDATEHPFAPFEPATMRLVREMRNRTRASSDLVDVAERVVEREEDALLQLAADAWNDRAVTERALGDRFEMSYRAVDTMLGFCHGLGRILSSRQASTEAHPPQSVGYATSLLLVGAVGAGHESMAMLRAGLTAGAEARWRTVHEFAVVAGALRAGNRGTASRFVAHRWVQIDQQLRWAEDDEWQDLRRTARMKVQRLAVRYGQEFVTTYGWAADLTQRELGVKRPAFRHLEQLSGFRYHWSQRMTAHHLVHADALAMTSRMWDGMLHSGGDTSKLRDVCARLIFTLHDVNDALLELWLRYLRSDGRVAALRALNAELGTVLQRDCSINYVSADSSSQSCG